MIKVFSFLHLNSQSFDSLQNMILVTSSILPITPTFTFFSIQLNIALIFLILPPPSPSPIPSHLLPASRFPHHSFQKPSILPYRAYYTYCIFNSFIHFNIFTFFQYSFYALSTNLAIYLSIYLPTNHSINQSIYLSIYLPTN